MPENENAKNRKKIFIGGESQNEADSKYFLSMKAKGI
jgi:hypothetical protein